MFSTSVTLCLHGGVGLFGQTKLYFMSYQQATIRVTPTTDMMLHLDFPCHLAPRAVATTARSNCSHQFGTRKITKGLEIITYIFFCGWPQLIHLCVYFLCGAPALAVQRLSLFVIELQNSSAECEVLGYRKKDCSLTRVCDKWRYLTIAYPVTWTQAADCGLSTQSPCIVQSSRLQNLSLGFGQHSTFTFNLFYTIINIKDMHITIYM